VDEANHAFAINMDMFKELQGNWLMALIQLTWNALVGKIKSWLPKSAKANSAKAKSSQAKSIATADKATA
jgi:heme oxygenase